MDLLVCDEAHRLKNARGDTQTVAGLRALKCPRRVLLSGTPIQNDLGEFFAVMDFACPSLLGGERGGSRVSGFGFTVYGLRFTVYGLRFTVYGLGFRV